MTPHVGTSSAAATARELARHSDTLKDLRRRAREGPITLVYSARDEIHNDAVVLRNVILGRADPMKEHANDQ